MYAIHLVVLVHAREEACLFSYAASPGSYSNSTGRFSIDIITSLSESASRHGSKILPIHLDNELQTRILPPQKKPHHQPINPCLPQIKKEGTYDAMRATQLRLLLIFGAQDAAHGAEELDVCLARVGAEGLDECLPTSTFNVSLFFGEGGMGDGRRRT